MIEGDVYTDGSVLGGPDGEFTRIGWAFVTLNADLAITAAAHGIPPPKIEDIGGAEAWALLQAAKFAAPA